MLLHHPQVFDVLMRLEEELSCKQLYDDAANRPHIAYMAPLAASEDDLW